MMKRTRIIHELQTDIAIRVSDCLGAGDGTRVGDRSDGTPKPLLEFDGCPLILHVLETDREERIKNAIDVIGYEETDSPSISSGRIPVVTSPPSTRAGAV